MQAQTSDANGLVEEVLDFSSYCCCLFVIQRFSSSDYIICLVFLSLLGVGFYFCEMCMAVKRTVSAGNDLVCGPGMQRAGLVRAGYILKRKWHKVM